MLGYTREDIINMAESIGIAYDSTYSPEDLKDGLAQAYEFFINLLDEVK
jgi:hypothetical protein